MGRKREYAPLLNRDQGVLPNPEQPSWCTEDPKSTLRKNPLWGGTPGAEAPRVPDGGILPSPGTKHPSSRPRISRPVTAQGRGVPSASPMRGSREPHGHSLGSPSALPRVTPARPAQGGAAALPTRCLTVSADGGGGMRAESGPGRARTSAPTRAASDWLSLAELRRGRAERGGAWTGRGYGRSPVRKLRLRTKLANSCYYLASTSSSTKGANLLGSCP